MQRLPSDLNPLGMTPTPRPLLPQVDSSAPAFPSDASPTISPHPSRPGSRRPSFAVPMPIPLSRRSSMASGPHPITKAEFSGPQTPSLLSRAGSPTLPLGREEVPKSRGSGELSLSRRGSAVAGTKGLSALDGKRELRKGEFIGSVDCGTT